MLLTILTWTTSSKQIRPWPIDRLYRHIHFAYIFMHGQCASTSVYDFAGRRFSILKFYGFTPNLQLKCCADMSTRLREALWRLATDHPAMAAASAASLPAKILELIFSCLDLTDVLNCATVCKSWHNCLNDENSLVWRVQCTRKLAGEARKGDLLSEVPSYKAILRAYYHSFNLWDCSRNVYVKQNGFTLHRNPVAQSTDAARGRRGFRNGRHAWEVWWEGPLGTVAVVGIATKNAPLQCQGYVALLGSNDQSWGWNLVDNYLSHNGDHQGNFPQCNNAPKYEVSFSPIWICFLQCT